MAAGNTLTIWTSLTDGQGNILRVAGLGALLDLAESADHGGFGDHKRACCSSLSYFTVPYTTKCNGETRD